MKSLEERLNDRLEQVERGIGYNELRLEGFMPPARTHGPDKEVDELLAMAHRLQRAHQLQIAPAFASQLERRLIRHSMEMQLQRRSRRHSFFSARPALSAALGLCLLLFLFSTSMLALAAQSSDPMNPLYGLKRWEQHLQVQLSGSLADQASLDLKFARDGLNTIPGLENRANSNAYRQALTDLDQQINTAASTINTLPAGAQRTTLTSQVSTLKLETIHVLRSQLTQLALPDQLETTNELARLGDTVPHIKQVILTLPAQHSENVTISVTGLDLQSGASLLMNGEVVGVTGTLQQGQLIFLADWKGKQHPQSLGVLNPDGTANETTRITMNAPGTSATPGNEQHDKGNKPPITPTPQGNKPPVTPTPQGNKPPITPIPHP